MRVVRYRGEPSIDDLVRRLYAFDKTTEPKLVEARSALLVTNPLLSDMSAVHEGTPIVVPDVAGARPLEETDVSSIQAMEAARRSLDAVRAILGQAADKRRDGADAALRLLGSRQLARLTASDPELKSAVSRIREEATRLKADAGSTKKQQASALKELKRQFESVVKGH